MKRAVLAAVVVSLTLMIGFMPDLSSNGAHAASCKPTSVPPDDPVVLTVALLFPADGGVWAVWIEADGEFGTLSSSDPSLTSIDILDLLMEWDWAVLSSAYEEETTMAEIESALTAEFGQNGQQGNGKGVCQLSVEILDETGNGGWPMSGSLTVTLDASLGHSGQGYVRLEPIEEEPIGAASPSSPEGVSSPMSPAAQSASAGGVESGRYIVWPSVVHLGETLAVVLETQSEVELYSDGAILNANVEKFWVHVTDPDGSLEIIKPTAVIEAPAALGSLIAGSNSETWAAMIVVFDLPDPWGNGSPSYSLPNDFTVAVVYEGFTVYGGKTAHVLSSGGSVLPSDVLNSIKGLELRPMLRLRPSWDPVTAKGSDPNWDIGAIEVLLRYDKPPTGNVDNLEVRVNGDAKTALSTVRELDDPPAGQKLWRISLIDPDGFSLESKGCVDPGNICYSGQWSLLDLPLDKYPEGLPQDDSIFEAGHFTIDEVAVTDPAGNRLNSSNPETYFEIHAVNNLVEAPPGVASSDYLVWPTAVNTGDTVAVLINTELDVDTVNGLALLDANSSNTVIWAFDPDGYGVTVTPRAVIEAPAALGSFMIGVEGFSKTGVIAFFDIPDPWPNPSPSYPSPTHGSPAQFDIVPIYAGTVAIGQNSVQVVGTGGAATDFAPVAPLADLELSPMLRLRPHWDVSSTEGFDPGWDIGGMEFNLRYTRAGTGKILAVAGTQNGEAQPGIVMTEPLPDEGSDKLWKLSLLEPRGFSIPYKGCPPAGTECYSGRWALLDLLLEKDENGLSAGAPVFTADEFVIEDLKVFGRDGLRLNPTYSTDQVFFDTYLANNIAVPEPGATLQIVFGALGLVLLSRVRGKGGQSR